MSPGVHNLYLYCASTQPALLFTGHDLLLAQPQPLTLSLLSLHTALVFTMQLIFLHPEDEPYKFLQILVHFYQTTQPHIAKDSKSSQ
jgi:hypothetical protein